MAMTKLMVTETIEAEPGRLTGVWLEGPLGLRKGMAGYKEGLGREEGLGTPGVGWPMMGPRPRPGMNGGRAVGVKVPVGTTGGGGTGPLPLVPAVVTPPVVTIGGEVGATVRVGENVGVKVGVGVGKHCVLQKLFKTKFTLATPLGHLVQVASRLQTGRFWNALENWVLSDSIMLMNRGAAKAAFWIMYCWLKAAVISVWQLGSFNRMLNKSAILRLVVPLTGNRATGESPAPVLEISEVASEQTSPKL
jgi:hypothetical protein